MFDAGQCFTFDYARTIPKTDKIKKRDAFNMLQTTPDDFQWWMLAANLGSSTKRVIGAGLVKGHLVDRSQVHARLRFERRDGTKIYVKLNNVEGKGIRASVRE